MAFRYDSKEAEMYTGIATKARPVLAVELAIAWSQQIPIVQQRRALPEQLWEDRQGLPAPEMGPESILIWTADVLGHPITYARPRQQVGRFLLVEYQPIAMPDPEIILALMPGAQAFHRAMLDFQRARAAWPNSWSLWYQQAKHAARRALGPLGRLRPYPLEADFVIRWMLLACAKGQRDTQGGTQTTRRPSENWYDNT